MSGNAINILNKGIINNPEWDDYSNICMEKVGTEDVYEVYDELQEALAATENSEYAKKKLYSAFTTHQGEWSDNSEKHLDGIFDALKFLKTARPIDSQAKEIFDAAERLRAKTSGIGKLRKIVNVIGNGNILMAGGKKIKKQRLEKKSIAEILETEATYVSNMLTLKLMLLSSDGGFKSSLAENEKLKLIADIDAYTKNAITNLATILDISEETLQDEITNYSLALYNSETSPQREIKNITLKSLTGLIRESVQKVENKETIVENAYVFFTGTQFKTDTVKLLASSNVLLRHCRKNPDDNYKRYGDYAIQPSQRPSRLVMLFNAVFNFFKKDEKLFEKSRGLATDADMVAFASNLDPQMLVTYAARLEKGKNILSPKINNAAILIQKYIDNGGLLDTNDAQSAKDIVEYYNKNTQTHDKSADDRKKQEEFKAFLRKEAKKSKADINEACISDIAKAMSTVALISGIGLTPNAILNNTGLSDQEKQPLWEQYTKQLQALIKQPTGLKQIKQELKENLKIVIELGDLERISVTDGSTLKFTPQEAENLIKTIDNLINDDVEDTIEDVIGILKAIDESNILKEVKNLSSDAKKGLFQWITKVERTGANVEKAAMAFKKGNKNKLNSAEPKIVPRVKPANDALATAFVRLAKKIKNQHDAKSGKKEERAALSFIDKILAKNATSAKHSEPQKSIAASSAAAPITTSFVTSTTRYFEPPLATQMVTTLNKGIYNNTGWDAYISRLTKMIEKGQGSEASAILQEVLTNNVVNGGIMAKKVEATFGSEAERTKTDNENKWTGDLQMFETTDDLNKKNQIIFVNDTIKYLKTAEPTDKAANNNFRSSQRKTTSPANINMIDELQKQIKEVSELKNKLEKELKADNSIRIKLLAEFDEVYNKAITETVLTIRQDQYSKLISQFESCRNNITGASTGMIVTKTNREQQIQRLITHTNYLILAMDKKSQSNLSLQQKKILYECSMAVLKAQDELNKCKSSPLTNEEEFNLTIKKIAEDIRSAVKNPLKDIGGQVNKRGKNSRS